MGSYYYARAYVWLVLALTLIYALMSITLVVFVLKEIQNIERALLLAALASLPVFILWVTYGLILLAFRREGRYSIEIDGQGIKETLQDREHQFIPWAGVTEIELDATVIAGATLRLRGKFSEIVIPNVDLVIRGPMGIRRMHKEMGQLDGMRRLFSDIKAAAPGAVVKMNRYAERRMKDYEWATDKSRTHTEG
jgi:hypothetical protein